MGSVKREKADKPEINELDLPLTTLKCLFKKKKKISWKLKRLFRRAKSISIKKKYQLTNFTRLYLSVPPKITPFTFARDLKLGDRISVQCVVVSGDLPITFVWLKDGEPPPESETLIRSNPFTSDLSIESIAATHSGNYTCRASNQAATVSHMAPLSVNGKHKSREIHKKHTVTPSHAF